jgi:hypothetical protein
LEEFTLEVVVDCLSPSASSLYVSPNPTFVPAPNEFEVEL